MMADAKPQYFSAMGGRHAGGASQRKQSDAHDDLDFDFSMIVDAENDDLDFTLNDAGDVEHTMQEQIQPGGNLPSHSSSRSIPIPTGTDVAGSNPQGIPAVTATASIPLHPGKEGSQARAIPPRSDQNNQNADSSRPGSHDSSGSGFLSGILNPAASTFNNTQLSHTPPTAFGTSYENNHFGKRQRSGSISGRLRSASDLEDRGLIDKNQKGILKDLIICGDEDLQRALDQYEGGDPTVLQDMISSGALQNKAVPDLDLLGDLDLDFLTVHDSGDIVPEGGDGPGMYTLPNQQPGAHTSKDEDRRQAQKTSGLIPAPSFAAKVPPTQASFGKTVPPPNMTFPVHDDGIGELDFTGDFDNDNDHVGGYYGEPAHSDQQQQFNINGPHSGHPHRSGALTPPHTDEQRLRSNSLFSALINDPRETGNQELQYGKWMDHMPKGNQAHMQTLVEAPDGTGTSNGIPIPDTSSASYDTGDTSGTAKKPGPTKKKPGRRKSDSAVDLDRKTKTRQKEERAEQKRIEKQRKREQKEREKQEKKEARLAAKAEKKKEKEQNKKEQNKKEKEKAMEVEPEEEKPVHVPGSGRPRSMSDPNLRTTTDEFGLLEVERPEGWVGAYSPESRKVRIDKFLAKRNKRVWTKTVKYDVRKNFADSRLRVKGRFVKKEDEMLMRDLMSLT